MNAQQTILMRLQPNWQTLIGRQFPWLNVLVALLALAGLIVCLLWPRLQLVPLLVGDLLLATWLWVWFSLQKRARPGALELQLPTITACQEQQQVQLDWLMTCLLQRYQGSALYCLYRLAVSEPFLLRKDASTRQAIEDVRYLNALGLIDQVAGQSLRTFLEALQEQTEQRDWVDVKDYFWPTKQGQKYLSLLQSHLVASLADC